MSLYKISQMGHPVLNDKSKPVPLEEIKTKEIQDLIESIITTLHDAEGVGLAAPQVYEPKRIIIIDSQSATRKDRSKRIALTVIINPKITTHSQEMELDWEGCLSVANGDLLGLVPRSKKIKVTGFDRHGQKLTFTASSFKARVIQHELDHLDGILFLQKVMPQDLKYLAQRKEWMKYYKPHWPKPKAL